MNAPDDRTHTAAPDTRVTITASLLDSSGTGTAPAPTQPAPTQPAPDALPDVAGFQLVAQIGRGGMGAVFRARDTALHRDVAVKILRFDYPPVGPVARRFVEEAQITSQLQHPGIPPIHQVGALADGRPFLVMKLIKGDTLDKRLRGRTDPGGGHSPPAPEDRGPLVAVFEQVCQAVGYAHAHNVVHRDLKPANVMVGAFGEVQVMDWGLAKALGRAPGPEEADPARTEIRAPRDDEMATQAGSVMGTPAFMPPEQAAGEVARVDRRSDVFGLGALLCVILTGRPPYVGPDAEAIRAMAIRGWLDGARERLNACGAEPELVALCKRCLEPDPDDRPRDANELARAVAAYRGAAEERARQAELDRVRAEGERAAAEVRAAAEANTRREAEARAVEQRKKRTVQLALVASVALFAAAGGGFAWWQDRQANEQRLKEERGEARRAREAAERDAERKFKAEQARQGVTAALALAADLRAQEKFKPAGAALAQAGELAGGGAPELVPAVERARADLALVVKLDAIRYRKWAYVAASESEGNFDTKIAPPEYRGAFAGHGLDLTALPPADAARRIAASGAKAELVAAVDDWAAHEPDRALRDRLLEVARRADPGPWTDRLRDPAVWADRRAVAKLAADADPATTSPAALSALQRLMEAHGLNPDRMLTAARARHPTNFELAFAHGRWHVHVRNGQQLGPFEAARALRPDNAAVWVNIGSTLAERGDFEAALAAYREALRLDPGDARVHTNVGVVLFLKGDFEGAIAKYREAVRVNPASSHAHNNLGDLLLRKGDADGALAAFREAVKHDPKDAVAHYNLGVALDAKRDFGSALAAYREAVKLNPRSARFHNNLGLALARTNDMDGAVAAFREALARDPKSSAAHNNLGGALVAKKDFDGALAAFREAAKCDPKDAKPHTNMGVIYTRQQKWPEAIACARNGTRADPTSADAHAMLGDLLLRTGDVSGARAALTEAARLDKRWAARLAEVPAPPVAPAPRAIDR